MFAPGRFASSIPKAIGSRSSGSNFFFIARYISTMTIKYIISVIPSFAGSLTNCATPVESIKFNSVSSIISPHYYYDFATAKSTLLCRCFVTVCEAESRSLTANILADGTKLVSENLFQDI